MRTGTTGTATRTPKPARLHLEVQPNPTTGNVIIKCRGLVPGRVAFIDLHNTQGHHLRRLTLNPDETTTQLTCTLELGGLPAGLYFCTLLTPHSPAVTQKIMLTR
jgi:hypothetical protein